MYKCQRDLSAHGFHAKLTRIYGQFADQLSLQLENRVVSPRDATVKTFRPHPPAQQ